MATARQPALVAPRLAVVSAGVLTIAVTYGLARYGYGLFVPELRDAFGIGTGVVGLLATGAYATYLAATALTAWAAPWLGVRRPVVAAGVLAAAGMGLIAIARDPLTLTAGVLIAGASSGIAYPPFSEAVKRLLPDSQQPTAIALINSGTSYGVLLSGPLALAAGAQWRLAWLAFALLALLAAAWSAVVLPAHAHPGEAERDVPTGLLSRRSVDLFAAALAIGVGTSVYWTFAVELVASHGTLPSEAGRVLVVVIGVAGIAGGFTGAAVRSFGPRATFCASTATLAGALLLLALQPAAWGAVVASGVLFGAAYFAATAYLGMWSLRLFPHRPAAGFAATYFLISVGQLIGPLPAGLLGETAGLPSAFYAGAALTLAAILFARPRRRAAQVGDAGPSAWRVRRADRELTAAAPDR